MIKDLSKYITTLFQPDGPALVRAEGEFKVPQGKSVFIAAKHAHITAILNNEEAYTLCHYDTLLEEVAGDIRYFVGKSTKERTERVNMLRAAQSKINEATKTDAAPHGKSYNSWVEEIVREEIAAILLCLQKVRGHSAPVNLIREVITWTCYRVAYRILGVEILPARSLLAQILIWVRNWLTKSEPVKLQGSYGASVTLNMLLSILFGHVFGTIASSNKVLALAAKWAVADSLKGLNLQLLNPKLHPENTLISALFAVREDFHEIRDNVYASHVRSIIYELEGAMIVVVGKALADIASLLLEGDPKEHGTSWAEVITLLKSEADNDVMTTKVINELLRLSGGTRLVRTVAEDHTYQKIELKKHDVILLLVDEGSRDEAAFSNPERFDIHRAGPSQFITFGPINGPHACYGQSIARTMIKEVMLAIDANLFPAEVCKRSDFFNLPDNMAWCFRADRPEVDNPRAAQSDTGALSRRSNTNLKLHAPITESSLPKVEGVAILDFDEPGTKAPTK
jgi:hypothetical protein